MNFFLDTNTCIYFLNGKSENIKNKIFNLHPNEIKITSIVKAELLYGAKKSERSVENISKVKMFLKPFETISFSDLCSDVYSDIRCDLEKRGNIIGPNDLIIAATVISNNGVLITNNIKEFKRVDNLKLDNWH